MGDGTAVGDTNLYRNSAGVLRTDSQFTISKTIAAQAIVQYVNNSATGEGLWIFVNSATAAPALSVGNSSNYPTPSLTVTGDGTLSTSGNLVANTAGVGLKVKEGTNAKMGVSTLVAGTVVTTSSRLVRWRYPTP